MSAAWLRKERMTTCSERNASPRKERERHEDGVWGQSAFRPTISAKAAGIPNSVIET
jgi:hypothetical protein